MKKKSTHKMKHSKKQDYFSAGTLLYTRYYYNLLEVQLLSSLHQKLNWPYHVLLTMLNLLSIKTNANLCINENELCLQHLSTLEKIIRDKQMCNEVFFHIQLLLASTQNHDRVLRTSRSFFRL